MARFKDQGKYKAGPGPLYNKALAPAPTGGGMFTPQDFTHDPEHIQGLQPTSQKPPAV